MSAKEKIFKKFTEGDFICEIRRLNRAITKLSNARDELQQENQQLKDNWNELKKEIKTHLPFKVVGVNRILDKMQELESNKGDKE